MPRKTATATPMNIEEIDNRVSVPKKEKKTKETTTSNTSASNSNNEIESASSSSDAEESADDGEGEVSDLSEQYNAVAFFEECGRHQDAVIGHLKSQKHDWSNKETQKAYLAYWAKLQKTFEEMNKQLMGNQKAPRKPSGRKGTAIIQNPKTVHSEVVKILGLDNNQLTHKELMNKIKDAHDAEAERNTTVKKGKDGSEKSETKISKSIVENGKVYRLLAFIASRNDEGIREYLVGKKIINDGDAISEIEYTQFNCLAKASFAEFKN